MNDDLHVVVGRKIAKYRKAAGLTQQQLGEKLSVALETISRMERGANTPSIKTLGRLGRALGIPAHEFLMPDGGATAKDTAIDELVTTLKIRKIAEIELVRGMAEQILAYLDTQAREE